MPIYAKRSVERIDGGGAHVTAIREFLGHLEQAVDRAYIYVLSHPLLGASANLDGYTQHWVKKWSAFLASGDTQLLGAAFGYAVESLVCAVGSVFRPACPVGYSVVYQLYSGGTRPDVVLMHSGAEVAWFDITSSGDQYHIFTSKVGWTTKQNVVELTYPSTDMSVVGAVAGASLVDDQAIDREIRFQKFYQSRFEGILGEMGQDLKTSVERVKRIPNREVGGDERRRRATKEILAGSGPFRGKTLNDQQVTVILYSLGLNPTTYGFRGSVSEGLGQHLVRQLLGVPQVTAPPQTVPSSFPSSLFSSFGAPPLLSLFSSPVSPPSLSSALVPVHAPRTPQFEFRGFDFGSSSSSSGFSFPTFGSSASSGFSFDFGGSSSSSGSGGRLMRGSGRSERLAHSPGVSRVSHKGARSRMGAHALPRTRPRLTVGDVLQQLTRDHILFEHITRAGIRIIDPVSGLPRTLTYLRRGFQVGTRRRRQVGFHSVPHNALPGPLGPPTLLQLPLVAPQPHLAFVLPLQGQTLPQALASVEVLDAVMEIQDTDEH